MNIDAATGLLSGETQGHTAVNMVTSEAIHRPELFTLVSQKQVLLLICSPLHSVFLVIFTCVKSVMCASCVLLRVHSLLSFPPAINLNKSLQIPLPAPPFFLCLHVSFKITKGEKLPGQLSFCWTSHCTSAPPICNLPAPCFHPQLPLRG